MGDTTDPGAAEAGVGRLTGRLMEALTSLCQAGERFVDSAAVGSQRTVRAERPTEVRVQRPRMIQSGPTMDGTSCTPGGNSEWMECQGLATRGRESDIGAMGRDTGPWRATSLPVEVRGASRGMADSHAW